MKHATRPALAALILNACVTSPDPAPADAAPAADAPLVDAPPIDAAIDAPPIDAPWPLWFQDADGDGYGDPEVSMRAPTQPEGHVFNDGDCDDTPASGADRFPGAPERCDTLDHDCDGSDDCPFNCAAHVRPDGPGGLYMLCASGPPAQVADAACRAQGMHLVRIDDTEEEAFLFSLSGVSDLTVLVGGLRLSDGTWRWFPDNALFWNNGPTGLYTHWLPGQPAGGDCMLLSERPFVNHGDPGPGWWSFNCALGADFACEEP
jgi:hypothetical protein